MLLAADIRNTDTLLGLLDDGDVVAHWRVSTDERRTADEWAVLLRGLLAEQGDALTGVAVSSTVPAVLHEWRAMLEHHFAAVTHVVVGAGVRTGLRLLVDNPREVGSDRVLNALAAAERLGGPAVVVDFGGTATTFDVINASGGYVGGAIAPGIDVGLDALGQRGAQLRKVELTKPRSPLAKNTVEALQSGIIFGTAAQVEGLVARLVQALGDEVAEDDVRVIATGRLAPLVVEECACFTAHEPWLTLHGLETVFSRNS